MSLVKFGAQDDGRPEGAGTSDPAALDLVAHDPAGIGPPPAWRNPAQPELDSTGLPDEPPSPASFGRRRLMANAAAGWIANFVRVGIQLLMLPVMAHLLGPAEFGLYALALPAVNFFQVLADGGLGTSLAREDEGSTLVWSTAFWVLLVTGVILSGVVAGWGGVLSAVTHEPRLSGLMMFLSTSFLLITLSVLPAARLTRRGNLVVFAAADMSSALAGAAFAFVLAVAGAGAWSLAVQYVTGFLIRAIILNAAAFAWPTLAFSFSALRPHISTGSSVLGSRLAEFASRLAENVMFGRMFGAASLGTYTFANQTPRFICEAAANPIWSSLYAQALHEGADEIAGLHTRLVRLLGSAMFPAVLLMAAIAPQMLSIMLGAKWAPAAILLQILLPSYALSAVASQSGAILLANNRNAITFWLITANSIGRVLAVGVGYWTGPIGVATGVAASNTLFAAAMFAAPSWATGGSPWQLVKGLVAPGLASLLAAGVSLIVIGLQPTGLPWLVLSLGVGSAVYIVAMALLEGDTLRLDMLAIWRIVARRSPSVST